IWNWDFGDGNTSQLQNPTHQYNVGGIFNVQLIVTADSAGYNCTDTIVQTIQIFTTPDVAFTWNPEPTILGDATNFFGSSPNSITTWDWDFDNGNFSNDQNPIHMYIATGNYFVELTVTDINGCQNSFIQQVTVTNAPALDFSWNYSCEGEPVQFTILSPPTDIPAVVSWNWDFGDGGTSVDMEPTHVYVVAGTYDVSLTIIDTMATSNTVLKQITVNPPPLALFSTNSPVCVNNEVQFSDNSTTPTGFITEWHWDFGDGSFQTVLFPDNPDVTHYYSGAGTYLTTLTVTNSDSCSNSTQNTITTIVDPIADFTYEATCASDSVLFTDLSTPNGGSDISSWFWDFGDGGTSVMQNPTHIYAIASGYNVILSIVTIANCTSEVTHNVIINTLPTVEISGSANTANINTPIQFYGNSTTGGIVTWMWDFDDGGSSTIQNPIHEYQNYGNYNVTLNVIDIFGCSNIDSVQIHIIPPPVFPDSNAIWNTIGTSLYVEEFRYRYGLIGDTTLTISKDTSYSYSKVYSLNDSTLSTYNSTYFGAVRTTVDKKVYVKLPDLPETILYDYSLEIGDTIWYNIGGAATSGSIVLMEQDHYKVVTDIDSILLLDNHYHNRWFLDGDFMNDIWIEGVGSVVWFGLFNPIITDAATNGDSFSFACFKQNDIPLYINNPECDKCFCYLLTSISKSTENTYGIDIYPNPAYDIVIVSFNNEIPQDAELVIYNTSGNCVFNTLINKANKVSINTNEWKKGLYLISIRDKNILLSTQKLIVE
ncbi:MAG: PKD domain-containing protein, partial [Bacteroidetes bacterium]|nr:PKD domain-containing protein [Bacteroidota bacterium]